MKKFDALKWIRSVREAQYEQDKNLTNRQKLAKTKAAAQAFRKSRGDGKPAKAKP
ncbi:MAG: hypothetical protein NT031_07155 [Planctomycetota bacterium]|nr:hypothetical protein [Planctomycetota bacterium]